MDRARRPRTTKNHLALYYHQGTARLPLQTAEHYLAVEALEQPARSRSPRSTRLPREPTTLRYHPTLRPSPTTASHRRRALRPADYHPAMPEQHRAPKRTASPGSDRRSAE